MSMNNSLAEIPRELIPRAEDLPGDLQGIAEEIGVDNTVKLVRRFQGSLIYICGLDHLVRKKRNREIREAYGHGEPVAALVGKYRLSNRQIRAILGSPESD